MHNKNILIIGILAMLLLVNMVSASTWNESLNTGLISYLKLDETTGSIAIDATGQTNATNNASTINIDGILGRAYYLDIANEANLAYPDNYGGTNTSGSISMWVKTSDVTSNTNFLFSSSDMASELLRVIINGAGTVQIQTYGSGGNNAMDGNITLTNDVWNHVVITASGSANGWTVYTNGQINSLSAAAGSNTGTWLGGRVNPPNKIRLGMFWLFGGAYYSNMSIDEFGIWDYELNQSLVTNLYNNGTGITYGETGGNTANITINYTSPTQPNNANVSQTWIYVNTSVVLLINGTYESYISFLLYNSLHSLLDNTTYYNLSWSNTTFNNTLSSENLSFYGDENITKYLQIPSSIINKTNITIAVMNLTGYENTTYPTNASLFVGNTKVWNYSGEFKGPGSSAWTTGLSDGLVSYYPFEDDVTDKLGINNLTDSGTANTTGKIGAARQFVRSEGDLLSIVSFNGIVLGNGARTVCAWLNIDTHTASYDYWLGSGVNAPANIFSFGHTSAPQLNGHIWGNDLVGATTLNDDTWYFVCTQQSGTTTSIWLNGKNDVNATNTLNTANSTIYIGADDGGIYNWDGMIDELGYWNRSLSYDEINQLYNGGSGITYNQIGTPSSITETVNQTNLTNALNTYLSTCIISNGFCNVPFIFHSDSQGILGYSAMNFSTGTSQYFRYINWTNLTDGIYYYNVTIYDNASNSNSTDTRKITLGSTSSLLQINYTTPTEANNSNVTQNWIYVNVSKNVTNEANITFTLYNSSNTFNGLCYQESVNVSNQSGTDGNCGLNYGGNRYYAVVGEGNDFGFEYDGNWSTYFDGYDSLTTFRWNYAKPINAVDAKIQISYSCAPSLYDLPNLLFTNYTIPNECFNANSNYLNFSLYNNQGGGTPNLSGPSCWNGSDWYILNLSCSYSVVDFYEEAIYWNISSFINQTTYTDNRTYENWTNLSLGDYWYQVTVTNTSNSQNSTELRKITLLTSLIYPQINFIAPTENNDSYKNQNWVDINTNVTTPNEANITFYLYNNAHSLLNSTTYTDNRTSENFTGLINGAYYYNVTVYDLNGLSNSTETRKITLDTTYPQIEFVPLTEVNNSNKSQNWIYANVSVNETNEANITFNLYSSFNGLCYQESANTTNQKGTDGSCNLKYTGNYNYDANSWDNKSYFYDGNWNTATNPTDPGGGYTRFNVYINYTKPTNSINAIFQVKDYKSFKNISIPSGCFNSSVVSLKAQIDYDYIYEGYNYILYACYDWDTSSWRYIGTPVSDPASVVPYLYEEAMYWNITPGYIGTIFTNSTREINWTDISNGKYLYNVNACNVLGLCNSTETREITLDTSTPQINYIAPTPDNNNYTTNDNFTVAVEVTEPNLATIGYSLVYTNNTQVSYSINAAPTLEKTIYLPPAYVNYSISDVFWDGYSPGSTVSYIWYYANGSDSGLQSQVVTAGYYTYYNPEPLQLITKIEIYLARGGPGGTVYEQNTRVHFSTIINSTLQEFTNLSEGTYYYNVTATDFAGNQNTTQTRNITIDRTAPYIAITFPLNNSYNVNPTTLNYTTNELNVGICWYSINGGTTNNTFTCGTNITGLTPNQGENTWMIKIEDRAFNVNETYVSFFLDSINPSISFQLPTETDGSYINRTNIQINVSASDTNLMDIIIKVYDSIYTEVASAFWTNVASNNFWFNFITPSNGVYYFNATATDIYGNINYTETRNVTTDTIYPTITYSTPTTPAGGPQNVTAIWSNMTGTDTNLVTIVSTLELISGGSAYSNTQTYTPTIAPIDSLYYNWTGLGQGIYRLSGYATDRAGLTTYITNRTINIDTAAPVMNYVSPTPGDGNTIYVNSYTVNVTALDPNLVGITIYYWQTNGSIQTQTTATAVNTLTQILQPDGIYYFNASAIDADSRISWLATRDINIQYTNQTVEACKELFLENGNYNIIDDLSSSSTCLNVTAANVNINCQGHSIRGNDAILANKPGLTLKNCIVDSPTKSALKIKGNSPSSATVYNSTFTGSVYGINVAPEGNLYADTITITNNDYGIYFNGSNNGNTLKNVLMSGNIYDSITFLNSSFNIVTNLTILTTVDTGNNGIVVFDMSTDNYFDGCSITAVNPKIWGLYDYSIKNILYSCYYGDSTHDSVDGTSQLIRSWPFTGSVLDKVRNKLQGASIVYTASLPINQNISYYNSTDNITYTTLSGITYTNSGALAQTNITEYMNIHGTTYLSTPYFFNASYNIFAPTSATLNMNSSSISRFHEFLLGNEIGSSQLSRIAMWLILGIVFLVGLAASIGFFIVRMRDGYSVVDIWKYFMILVIWLTMFTIMYYALAWFIMGTVYPKV